MRLAAYKKAINEAWEMPASIPELTNYFNKDYSPRNQAVRHILKIAREDIEHLFDSEFVSLYKYARQKMDSEG